MTPLLRVRAVTVHLGGSLVLDQVTLDVACGSRHILTGPNGAGKTTLLGAVCGTIRTTTGRIQLDDTDITPLPPHRVARLGVARTWQHPALCGNLTAAENILLACPRHASSGQRQRLICKLLDEAGLPGQASEPAHQLSYGQQRRLELAVALAAQPRLLLLDEPSAGLSNHDTDQLVAQLAALGRNVTVLLTEHNPRIIDAVAEQITALRRGQVTADAPVHTATVCFAGNTGETRLGRSGQHRIAPAAAGRQTELGPLLSVRNLSASRHHRPILTNVDLDLYSGQILAITGGNGAGKTTLLHAIAGLTPTSPTTGISLDALPVTGLRPDQRARRGLTLVPQDRRLFPGLSVADNLRIATRTTTTPRWTMSAILAALPGLAERLHQPATTLSGGEQQQLALARALLTQARVLLLDEPFEGLTPTITRQLHNLIVDTAGTGTGVIVVDHNRAQLDALAHTVRTLHLGTLSPAPYAPGAERP